MEKTQAPTITNSPLVSITMPCDAHPMSINEALRKSRISQRLRRKLRHNGIISVNATVVDWSYLLHPSDKLIITLAEESQLEPYHAPLSIMYEDEYLLVINKPAGLLMHPTSTVRNNTLANALVYYYKSTNQQHSFHPVHRLDKDTSGLVVVAKTQVVQHEFSKQKIRFHKVYDALVEGFIPFAYGTLHEPVGRKDTSIVERQCRRDGKAAHTDIVVIARGTIEGHLMTHIRCLLHTGRTHQIRVHLSHLGYPLVGDDLYGGSLSLLPRQALHATELAFTHPMTQQELHLRALCPDDMEQLMFYL